MNFSFNNKFKILLPYILPFTDRVCSLISAQISLRALDNSVYLDIFIDYYSFLQL